jgi:xylulokinase
MVSTPGALPGSYWLFGEQGIGGKSIEFILRNIVYAEDGFETGKMPDDMYTRFNEMAAKSPPGSRGLVFLPWLTGTLVPDENALVRGGFINLSLKTDRSDMARSVFEALAYNNRWTLSAMKRFTGKPVDHFRFSGGGALSDLFSQIHADVLGVPVHQMENPTHSTLLGTALLTFSILGNISYKDIPGLVKTRKVFEPDPKKRNIYDRIFKQYRELFRRNRPVFEALNS